MDPDPEGQKTCGSGGSATLPGRLDRNTAYLYDLNIAVPRRFLIGPGLALPSRNVFFSPSKHIKISKYLLNYS
jgi:hypothetical protein